MNIFLDSVRVSFEDAPETIKVGGLFNVMFNFSNSHGRAIFKTIIDGQDIPFDEIKNILDKDINEFERFDFFTVNKEELFAKFKDLGDPFIKIAGELCSLSVLLNEGKRDQALHIFAELPHLMHNLLSLSMLLPVLDLPSNIKFGEKTIAEYQEEINPLFSNVLDAFAIGDTVEASDIAEYELSPLVETLGKALKDGIKE